MPEMLSEPTQKLAQIARIGLERRIGMTARMTQVIEPAGDGRSKIIGERQPTGIAQHIIETYPRHLVSGCDPIGSTMSSRRLSSG